MKKINYAIPKSDFIDISVILTISILYRLFYFDFGIHGITYNSDSVSYFATVDIFKGIIDLYRTPVYPCIIHFFRNLSEGYFLRNLVVFQHTILVLSIIPFYFVAKHIIQNRIVVIFITIFYGCWNYIIDQSININPEVLCVVGSILLLAIYVKYINNPSRHIAILISIFSFILIMLKPTYLIVLGIIIIFFVIRLIYHKEEKKIILLGLIGWMIAIAGVLGYCELNKKFNGEFVLSKVELNNSLSNIITSGAYIFGEDQELINLIDSTKFKGVYVSVFLINNECIDNYKRALKNFPNYLPPSNDMKLCMAFPDTINFPAKRIRQFVKKSQFTTQYLKHIIKRIVNTFMDYIGLLIIMIVELIFIIKDFLKNRRIAWTLLFCIIFVLAQFTVIVLVVGQFSLNVDAPIERMDRLLVPSYPFLILIIGALTENLFSLIRKLTKFKAN
jgi:hypothetical protein